MGNGGSRPGDRAAGLDGANQGLTLREAADALVYRLLAVLQAVQGLRARMHNVYRPWAYELLDAQGMLEELVGELEHVQGTVLQTGYGPWPQALRDGERTLRGLIGRYRPHAQCPSRQPAAGGQATRCSVSGTGTQDGHGVGVPTLGAGASRC